MKGRTGMLPITRILEQWLYSMWCSNPFSSSTNPYIANKSSRRCHFFLLTICSQQRRTISWATAKRMKNNDWLHWKRKRNGRKRSYRQPMSVLFLVEDVRVNRINNRINIRRLFDGCFSHVFRNREKRSTLRFTAKPTLFVRNTFLTWDEKMKKYFDTSG